MQFKVILTARSFVNDEWVEAKQRFTCKDWDSFENLIGSMVSTSDGEIILKVIREEE